jgi:hypothetical protein
MTCPSAGTYAIRWLTPAGESADEAFLVTDAGVVTVPNESLVPSVADVAALLRARTKDVNGDEVGTFTSATRPTSVQIAGLAVDAAADVQARLGSSPPVGIEDAGRGAAAVLAAMTVELSFLPEQTQTGRSPYDQLREMFESRMRSLIAWPSETGPGGQRVSSSRIPVLLEEIIVDGVAVGMDFGS